MRSTIFLCVLLLVSACELITEVEVPDIEPRLVVNSFFRPDSSWSIMVSRHRHILAETAPEIPSGIVVTIKDDLGQTTTLELTRSQSGSVNAYQEFESPSSPKAGHSYTLEVVAPGLPVVHATAVAPLRVPLTNVRLDSANEIPYNYENAGSIPVEFTFQDPPGQKDYYIPQLLYARPYWMRDPQGNIKDTVSWATCWLTETAPGTGILENIIATIDDSRFDGKLITVRLYASKGGWSSNDPKSFPWKFHLTHVGEDYYKYRKSIQLQQDNDGNPLAQPVQVFTNIEGGLGIFAGAATSTWDHN
jgi:hypothetical protein